MKLEEIADRINEHLKRFEADSVINAPNPNSKSCPFYQAAAIRNGRYVAVKYVSYQHTSNLTRDEAEKYLAWLDAGNVGKHNQALAEQQR
jgi:hypothetical protein